MGEDVESGAPKGALAALMARKRKAKNKAGAATEERPQEPSGLLAPALDSSTVRGGAPEADEAPAAPNPASSSTWTQQYAIEQKAMQRYGLEMERMDADGACLFRSFAAQLLDDPERHQEVRDRCVDFLERHRDDFEPFVVDGEDIVDFRSYTKSMREPLTWGGDIEVQALSRAYEVNVAVFVPITFQKDAGAAAAEAEEAARRALAARKKKAKPLWLQEEEDRGLEADQVQAGSTESEIKADALLAGGQIKTEREAPAERPRPPGRELQCCPSDLLREEFGKEAQVIEMFNFEREVAACVTVSYHPAYHLGKHYNAVRVARSTQEEPAGAPLGTVAELTEYMARAITKSAAAEKEQQQAGGSKKKPITSTRAIFG